LAFGLCGGENNNKAKMWLPGVGFKPARHCEPTGPARSGRPDDKLREAIQFCQAALDCFVAALLAMTG
jgi:hypothetical protein